jgi:hypothetical protein
MVESKAERTMQFIWWLRSIPLVGVTTVNTRSQMVCTFIDTHCNYTTCSMWSLRRSSRSYWSAVDCDGRATCSWSRLTALLVGRLLGTFLFTEARSMGGGGYSVKSDEARDWVDPAGSHLNQRVSWSGWFPLKSSPTCYSRWLHWNLQNVPPELHCWKCTC